MPTFLDNSLAGLNRGWQQLYGGQQTAGPPSTNLYGQPAATPAATPVAANPAVGQPLSGEGSTDIARGPNEDQMLGAYYAHLLGLPFIRRMAAEQSQNGAAPMAAPTANNPEQGQTLSGSDGSGDGSGAGLLSTGGGNPLANLFQYIFQAGQNQSQGQPASFNQQPWYGSGAGDTTPQWPAGSQVVGTPGSPNSYVLGPQGPNPGDSSQVLATGSDTASPGGGGGMGGMGGAGGMAGSAIGAIGSGISDIGKGISNTKSTYTAPNIPLPQRATFTPPSLAPNRNF